MEEGFIAVLITFFIIISAIKTRRCVECMLFGTIIAAIFAYQTDFLYSWCQIMQNVITNNIWVILICLFFGALISLLTASKGSFGFSRCLSKICTSQRRTLLTTFFMGILIFVDDYLNVLSIGACMKQICDKMKLPRESLAYILDSTGAPVCVLIPISTWSVFYANLFYEQDSVHALGYSSPIQAYIHAIPFCFYPIITLIIVFLFALGLFPKIGAMKKAYQRVKSTDAVYSEFSKKYNRESYQYEEDGNLINFLLPMGTLISVSVFTRDILISVIFTLFLCFFMYIPRKIMTIDEYLHNIFEGFQDMMPTITMLIVAFILKDICEDMKMTAFIIKIGTPVLVPLFFPSTVFILSAGLAFLTGSDWGMSSIITPVAFPLGVTLGVNPLLIMAAIISGGTFGSHACFYSDATLLAAHSSGIDSMEHAISQIPYVIIASMLSIAAFIVAAFFV